MKATVEYDLSDRDDFMKHIQSLKAQDMALVLYETEQTLCAVINEGSPELEGKSYRDVLEHVLKSLREIMNDRSVNLNELLR